MPNVAWSWACVAGYVCETHNNPPDFFLDILNGDSTAIQAQQGLLTF